MKNDIAKDGVFTMPGFSPIESVNRSPVEDVLFYAMLEKLSNDERIKNL